MSDFFGTSAAKLAGVAARNLGWRPDEFWRSTPADLLLALSDPDAAAPQITQHDLNRLMEREHNG